MKYYQMFKGKPDPCYDRDNLDHPRLTGMHQAQKYGFYHNLL